MPNVLSSRDLVFRPNVADKNCTTTKKCSGIKGPYALTHSSGAQRRLRLDTKSLKLSQSSAALRHALCRRWLQTVCDRTQQMCIGKFNQLLPLLTNRHLPLLTRGKAYPSCVRSVMLHAAETRAILNRLRHNDFAMIRKVFKVKAMDDISSDSLLSKFGSQDLDVVLRTSRMRWFGM